KFWASMLTSGAIQGEGVQGPRHPPGPMKMGKYAPKMQKKIAPAAPYFAISFKSHFEAQKVRILKMFACGEPLSANIPHVCASRTPLDPQIAVIYAASRYLLRRLSSFFS